MAFLGLFLPVLCVGTDPVIGTVHSGLDPDRITWWREKWSPAPVTLSSNHKSVTGVSVTFYFTPTTSIVSGVLEITFPTGFSLVTVTGASGQIVQTVQTLSGGVDSSVTLQGVTNPSAAGAYGPFALRSRYSASGQTIDLNLNFGYVYILADAGTLGSLTVTLGGSASNSAVNKSGNSLLFKFRISVSLWRFDTFVISFDSRWKVETTAGCSSQDYTGRWNNFNGSSTATPHVLNCLVSQKTQGAGQTVYIYGLAVEGINTAQTADNQYVALLVNSVTTPDRVLTVNNYSWTVATTRFGTSTVLEKGSVVGTPVITPDVIYSATWTPTWGMTTSYIIPGLIIYMDLSFPLPNAIPQGGGIAITVSEDVQSGSWPGLGANCFIVTPLTGATCATGASGSISANNFPAVSQGTLITIRNVVKFTSAAGAGAQAVSIKTYDGVAGSSNVIDSGQNLPLVTIGSSGTLATSLDVKLVQGTGAPLTIGNNPAGGTGDNNGYLTFEILADTSVLISTSKVTFYCPLAANMDDFNLSIPAGSNHVWKSSASLPADMTSSTTAFTSISVTPSTTTDLGVIQWNVPPGLTGLTAGTYISTAHYTGSASSGVSLPRVAVNLATAYECRMEITDSTGVKLPHRFVKQIRVSPRPYRLAAFNLPCLDGQTGAPGIIQAAPDLIPFMTSTSTATYYLEFQFTMTQAAASTATGLTIGNSRTTAISYPAHSSATGTNAYIYADTASTITLLLTGYQAIQPGLTPANQINVYLPLPNNTPTTSPSVKISSAYYLQSDPRYAHITYQATVALGGTTTTAVTGTTFSVATATGSTIVNGNYVDSAGLSLTLKLPAALAQTSPWVYFLLPTGTIWGSNKAALVTGGGFGLSMFFSSPTSTFAYPGLLVQTGTGSMLSDTVTMTYILKGFALPLGASSSISLKIIQGDSQTAACVASSSISLTSAPGTISSVTISPTSIPTRGPDGVNVKMALTFQLTHGLPAGGSVQLVIPPSWQTTSCGSICTVIGLQNLSSAAPLQCVVTSNTATVTSFADFQNSGNSPITLTVSGLLPPLSPSTYNFVQSLSSFTSTGVLVDQYTVSTASQVTVKTESGTGLVNWQAKKTYPMNALATAVDLYLRFSLTHMLPACGLITIVSPLTWRLTVGDLKNNCYVTPTPYTSCSVTSAGLEIVLRTDTPANTALEVYLDAAVDNPGSQTSSGFRLTATWSGILIDSDPTIVQPGQQFTPTPLLTSILTPSSAGILVAPLTSGESASYSFNFTESVPYTPGDFYWIMFPPQFDLFIGDVSHWFSYEGNVYYIPCDSSVLGKVWCTVDHGVVAVSGTTPVTAGQLVSITLTGVVNPAPGETGHFTVCHVNSTSSYLTVEQAFGKVTLTALPGKVDFRQVSFTSSTVQEPTTLVFRFYLSETVTTNTLLQLLFPPDYDLTHFSTPTGFICSTIYTDESNPEQLSSLKDWNQATLCPLQSSRNMVILPAPTATFTFTSALQVSWTLNKVTNPQIGVTRSAFSATSDFDLQDKNLWPEYSTWTRKFNLFVYQTNSKTYTSRTYSNLHSAYTGLSSNLRSLMVAKTVTGSQTSKITVYAGTQSPDFYLSTGVSPCADQKIVLTPSTNEFTPDNNYLKYTSYSDNFTIKEGGFTARFRVAAAAEMAKGLYLVDWKVMETPQSGVTNALYTPLPSTVVEVYRPSAGQFQVQVASIPIILVGYTSVPIKVTCTNAPHSDLTVSLSILTSPPYLTIIPASLLFTPDVNELYFQIQLDDQFSTSSASLLSLVLSLSGTNAEVYSVTSPVTFPVGQARVAPSAGVVLTWGISSVGRTKATMQAKVDQAGVLYWHLAAAGTVVPSFEELRSAVGPLNPLAVYNSTNTRGQGSGETWIQYQNRLLKSHLMSSWIGSLAVSDPTVTNELKIDWLWADCTYQISGYLDNLNPFPVGVNVHTETFTTLSVAPVQPFSLKFQGAIDSFRAVSIAELAAKYQGVNPQRLFNPTTTTSFTRRSLQTLVTFTTFSYTLVPSRDLESSDPATQAVITGTALTSLRVDLNATLGISSTLYSVVNTAVPAQVSPIWSTPPKAGNATTMALTVTMRSSVQGTVCCLAATTSTVTPTAQQVLHGLTATNEEGLYGCSAANLTETESVVEIGNLTAQRTYYVYCTAEDAYPLWHTPMIYTTSSPLEPLALQTSAPASPVSVSSSALCLCLVLSLLA